MDHTAALRIIRDAFAHVAVEQIIVEYDPLIEGEVAKVVVRDEHLTDALGENGIHARRAAVESGLCVEVVLSTE